MILSIRLSKTHVKTSGTWRAYALPSHALIDIFVDVVLMPYINAHKIKFVLWHRSQIYCTCSDYIKLIQILILVKFGNCNAGMFSYRVGEEKENKQIFSIQIGV